MSARLLEIRKFEGRGPIYCLCSVSLTTAKAEIETYYRLGDVLVAVDNNEVVGLALLERDAGALQIISLAVTPSRQGQGIGGRLIEEAANYCRLYGVTRLIVCTGAWETANIEFYTKRGFCLFHVEPRFFTPEKGYAEYGDQVQFDMKV